LDLSIKYSPSDLGIYHHIHHLVNNRKGLEIWEKVTDMVQNANDALNSQDSEYQIPMLKIYDAFDFYQDTKRKEPD
jgi:hypothetical protein